MKKLLKNIVAFGLVMVTCLSSSAWGVSPSPTPSQTINLTPQETSDLIDLFKACDATATSCEKANRDKDALVAKQGEALAASQAQLQAERASHTGIMESKTTWFVLGALFTGLTVFLTAPRH